MLVWHGILQVQGLESSKMIAGIAGAGHMLLGAGFILLLLGLRSGIRRTSPHAELVSELSVPQGS
ncbi:DUF2871 family protein [Microbacterium sp.]|uniref:DUF2871 family protein n=1 Tax=Microbacterium sp. TaxID=51671 RepID=UPI002628F201|nr:DUF2871 family protein [Microbacterium sp.]